MTEMLLAMAVVSGLVLCLTASLLILRRRLVPQAGCDVVVNEATHLAARRGQKLLEVLHAAGIGIPAACGGKGTCGLCRVAVTGAGAGEPQATERGMLSPKERRAGMRLACQAGLRGDCAVAVPEEVFSAGGGFTARVASVRMLAPLIREIVLDLPRDRAMTFRAGDFMQVTAPAFKLDFATIELPQSFAETWEIAQWRRMRVSSEAAVTRAYSLANRPEDAGRAVFNIRLAVPPAGREQELPPGLVSSWLFTLSPGDEVPLSGPFGDFHVQETGREMVFIGGGVGMAPLRAMIHETLAAGTDRPIRYFYGARARTDLYYASEFERLATRHPNFSWTPALSDPAPGDRWTGAIGFVHEILEADLDGHPAPEDCEFYLCGPPVMISAVLATLGRLGVEPSSIFHDDFGA